MFVVLEKINKFRDDLSSLIGKEFLVREMDNHNEFMRKLGYHICSHSKNSLPKLISSFKLDKNHIIIEYSFLDNIFIIKNSFTYDRIKNIKNLL